MGGAVTRTERSPFLPMVVAEPSSFFACGWKVRVRVSSEIERGFARYKGGENRGRGWGRAQSQKLGEAPVFPPWLRGSGY